MGTILFAARKEKVSVLQDSIKPAFALTGIFVPFQEKEQHQTGVIFSSNYCIQDFKRGTTNFTFLGDFLV